MSNTTDVLIEMKNVLVHNGWVRGALEHHDGAREERAFCLMGALLRAQNNLGFDSIGAHQAVRVLDTCVLSEGSFSFVHWNDLVARDKQHVLDLLDAAIAYAKDHDL